MEKLDRNQKTKKKRKKKIASNSKEKKINFNSLNLLTASQLKNAHSNSIFKNCSPRKSKLWNKKINRRTNLPKMKVFTKNLEITKMISS